MATVSILSPQDPMRVAPSYDTVAAKVDRIVGNDPTAEKYAELEKQLSDEEIDVLVKTAPDHPPFKTEKDRETYTNVSGVAFGNRVTDEEMQQVANEAIQAAKDIDEMFFSLQLQIRKIDQIHESGFTPVLEERKKDYHVVLTASRDLAARTAAYTTEFNDSILKLANLEIDKTTKLFIIDEYLNKVNNLEPQARGIEQDFENLKSKFGDLVASFSDWAKDKEVQLEKEIQDLQNELVELEAELATLNIYIHAFEGIGALGVGLFIMGAFIPGIGFAFSAAGMVALGVSTASLTGLMIARTITMGKIARIEAQIKRKEGQIEEIRRARAELEQLGEYHYISYGESLNLLKALWNNVAIDCTYLRVEIDKAKTGIPIYDDFPDYLDDAINNGNEIYLRMASYLDAYARGLPM